MTERTSSPPHTCFSYLCYTEKLKLMFFKVSISVTNTRLSLFQDRVSLYSPGWPWACSNPHALDSMGQDYRCELSHLSNGFPCQECVPSFPCDTDASMENISWVREMDPSLKWLQVSQFTFSRTYVNPGTMVQPWNPGIAGAPWLATLT